MKKSDFIKIGMTVFIICQPILALAEETSDYYIDKYYRQFDNGQSENYVYLNGLPLGEFNSEGELNYYLTDHLQSPSVITNNQGEIVETRDYGPYGQSLNNDSASSTTDLEFNFKPLDKESGLQYFGNRYYDNQTGKFVSYDPLLISLPKDKEELNNILSEPQRLNNYSYALNNPVANIDPDGQASLRAWLTNPLQTFAQVSFWKTAMNAYLRPKNYQASADFLNHSLSLNPGKLTVRGDNQYNYVIEEIRNSHEYSKFIDREIVAAEKGGMTGFYVNSAWPEQSDKKLSFQHGDLATAIGGTQSTRIVGQRNKDGDWYILVELTDRYDFHYRDYQKSDFPVNLANNLAAPSQLSGALSPYDIDIKFYDFRRY